MITIAFGRRNSASGRWFIRDRVYLWQIPGARRFFGWWYARGGPYLTGWTPFVKVRRRYK